MNLGKITLITPPDNLFDMTLSYLLVKPSLTLKQQFNDLLNRSIVDVNVFIFDDRDTDISWLLSVSNQVDCVIIDIDNCDPLTKLFVTFMLPSPNVKYITNDEVTPYGLVSKNRIFDLSSIVRIQGEDEDDESSE